MYLVDPLTELFNVFLKTELLYIFTILLQFKNKETHFKVYRDFKSLMVKTLDELATKARTLIERNRTQRKSYKKQ